MKYKIGSLKEVRKLVLEESKQPKDYGPCDQMKYAGVRCDGRLIKVGEYVHMEHVTIVKCNVCGYEREIT